MHIKKIPHLLTLTIFSICLCGYGVCDENPSQDRFDTKRRKMVEEQIVARGIKSPKTLEAFLKVERHLFVPKVFAPVAYADGALPIGAGQTISQPYLVALMTEVLNLAETDRVLEVGTGSGYQAAILGELCDSVFTIEIVESLGKRADKLLQELGYNNINVKIGDGFQGWEEHAPFDAIIVTCAPTGIPQALKNQLKEGGRMIIPVGDSFYQELIYLRKTDNELKRERVLPVLFVPMVDTTGTAY
jgi:protein-L-isoaspartate(D-aspartate) O-methyltransferase